MIGVVALQVVLLASGANGSAAEKNVPTPIELAPGEYELTADVVSASQQVLQSKGSLVLRKVAVTNQLATRYQLFGWTEVEFRKLGAPIDESATPAQSRDPDNPGVLLLLLPPGSERLFKHFKVRPSRGAPILLIGTVENKKQTRGWNDGGGIGLFVQSQQGRCSTGAWTNWGILVGRSGHFKICPHDSAEEKATPESRGPSK
jgi:hypothetical protein